MNIKIEHKNFNTKIFLARKMSIWNQNMYFLMSSNSTAHIGFPWIKKKDSLKQIHFSPKKKYFVTNLKAPVKIKTETKNCDDYDRVVELSSFWK